MRSANQNVIFTIMMGSDPSYRYVEKCFARYAEFVSADLYILREEVLVFEDSLRYPPLKRAWLQKFYIDDLLQNYKRVLFLDADIIINKTAPNIFDEYLDENKCYLFDEGEILDRTELMKQTSELLGGSNELNRQYFNSGVILVSQKSNYLRNWSMQEIAKITGVEFFEQSYQNFLILRDKIPAASLPASFNRMNISGPAEERFNAYFIHHASGAYSRKARLRYKTLIEDYCKIYQYELTLMEKLQLLFREKKFLIQRFVNRYLDKRSVG